MKLFIDSADPEEIKQAKNWGLVDGVTTNPSLAAKTGRPYKEIVEEILELVDGPVSLEVVATDYDGMIGQAKVLSELGDNVVVKLPCTQEGFKATKALVKNNIKVNMTLCFSANQALIAAKMGAEYISPFIGRLDDIAEFSGDELVEKIRTIYDNYGFETKILTASIRDVQHVERSSLMGADVATIPFKVLKNLHKHSLTDKGLKKFEKDWEKSGLKLPA